MILYLSQLACYKNEVKILDDKEADKAIPEDYAPVLETIISKIKAAQARAISAINFELVTVYRDIGQIIHEKQSRVIKNSFADCFGMSIPLDLRQK